MLRADAPVSAGPLVVGGVDAEVIVGSGVDPRDVDRAIPRNLEFPNEGNKNK